MQPWQQVTAGPAALARRLRELRQQWPGARVTQRMLADAFGTSPTLISAWESPSNQALPPATRLRS